MSRPSFKAEINRICRGNVYRPLAYERAAELIRVCNKWRSAVEITGGIRQISHGPMMWVGPVFPAMAVNALNRCAVEAMSFVGGSPFGLGVACKAAKDAASDFPDVFKRAAYAVQRYLP